MSPSRNLANSGKNAAVVVGYGRMGRIHARVLAELGHDVVTVDPVAVDADVTTITDVRGPVGVVAVAVPIPALHDVAMEALAAWQPARMLVEKPGAVSPVDMQRMAARAAMCGTRVAIGYTERHNPATLVLRDQLHAGRAPITHMTAARYAPGYRGDPALDIAVHDLDLAQWLAPGCAFGWRGGDGAHHVRIVMCQHDDGDTSVIDLRAHTLDGVQCDGPEPVAAEWRALLDAPAHPVTLRAETMTITRALMLAGG